MDNLAFLRAALTDGPKEPGHLVDDVVRFISIKARFPNIPQEFGDVVE
ncbi:hypothetical protein [Microvirga makkahensis]|uniref:Uncharacterized protein n=1 Tax=Microvirga makkahensis TaxID=1128670 RepID=A0A7X3MX95_9HYPH|nr:hypothetical protein [Microvirga makkahensis]MXQ14939.1 hypothetical protein [Microvirga makkahensis]